VVAGVRVVLDERRKFQLALRRIVWRRRRLPYLDEAALADGKVASFWRECESRDRTFEREMVQSYPPLQVGKDRSSIVVDGEQKVSLRGEGYPRDVLPVGVAEGVRCVAGQVRLTWRKRLKGD
jgi:hypothetical protein